MRVKDNCFIIMFNFVGLQKRFLNAGGNGKDETSVGPTSYDDNIYGKQTDEQRKPTIALISKIFLQGSRLDYTNRLKTMATTTTGLTP